MGQYLQVRCSLRFNVVHASAVFSLQIPRLADIVGRFATMHRPFHSHLIGFVQQWPSHHVGLAYVSFSRRAVAGPLSGRRGTRSSAMHLNRAPPLAWIVVSVDGREWRT